MNKIQKARRLIKRVYAFASGGGNLHGQICDGNLEDWYFEEFKDWLGDTSPEQLQAERECFNFLKDLTYEQRQEACGYP